MFFNQFSFQCLCNCHDKLLLACVFEEFWFISYETYGLDCAHHFTASNVAVEIFNRVSKSDVKLPTYQNHLDMVELHQSLKTTVHCKQQTIERNA